MTVKCGENKFLKNEIVPLLRSSNLLPSTCSMALFVPHVHDDVDAACKYEWQYKGASLRNYL